MAKRTASERDQAAKRQVQDYLLMVQLERQWSQSEIGRRMGVHPSSANKAFSGKHIPDLQRLMVLSEASGLELPSGLTMAYKALTAPVPTLERPDLQTFLEGSPEVRRMVEIAQRIAEAPDAASKKALQKEMRELAGKVG